MLSETATHFSQERRIFWGEILQTVFSIITFLNYNLRMHMRDRERLSIPKSTQNYAHFQNYDNLKELRASRSVSKDNYCSNAPDHFCSIPSPSLFQHNSCKGKKRPVEKEPWLGFSLGVTRSDHHFENTEQFLSTFSELTPLKRHLRVL